MKLILTHEVTGLGRPVTSSRVKDGYGRNYLLPRGLATPWTKGGQKQVDALTKGRAARAINDIEQAKSVKGRIEAMPVKVAARPVSRAGCSVPSATVTSPRRSRRLAGRSWTSARSRSSRPSSRSARTRRPSACTPTSRDPEVRGRPRLGQFARVCEHRAGSENRALCSSCALRRRCAALLSP